MRAHADIAGRGRRVVENAQVEGLVVWTFADVANLVYAGNLSGSWLAGVQGYETAGGTKGCFGGHQAGVPGLADKGAAASAEEADPTVGG